jgi:hypothetical protein
VTAKRDAYREKIERLRSDWRKLEAYLLRESGLPGPRGNLELAAAFSDVLERAEALPAEKERMRAWLALSSDEAPTNSKAEYLVFCAAEALGVEYLQATEADRADVFARLRAASRDPRWRTREAVCNAFQRIGERDFDEVRRMFAWWIERANMLDQRAIVAALAHPPILTDEGRVAFCLEIAARALEGLEKLPRAGRATEEHRVLKKAMEFVVSVYTAAAPDAGFRFLSKWASSEDVDIKKIVAANIRKSRLAKLYPERCQEVGEALSGGF